jgi:hypothetical protein
MKVKYFLLCVALLLAGFIFMPRTLNFTPEELKGTWKTDFPSHAERFFRVTGSVIVFETGNYGVDVYFISNVERTVRGGEIHYKIEYHKQGGNESALSLLFDPAPPQRIFFENQRQIEWRREDSEV